MKIERWDEGGFKHKKYSLTDYTIFVSIRNCFYIDHDSYFVRIRQRGVTYSGYSIERSRGSKVSVLDAFKKTRHALDLETFRRL